MLSTFYNNNFNNNNKVIMTIIKNYRTSYNFFTLAKKLKFTHMLHNSVLSLLNPWFITGFVDAEGCFLISVLENK